jgi:hypothetical protein
VVCRACPPCRSPEKEIQHAGPIWKPIALFLNVRNCFGIGLAPKLGLFQAIATGGASICSATTKKNPRQLPCLGFLVKQTTRV